MDWDWIIEGERASEGRRMRRLRRIRARHARRVFRALIAVTVAVSYTHLTLPTIA